MGSVIQKLDLPWFVRLFAGGVVLLCVILVTYVQDVWRPAEPNVFLLGVLPSFMTALLLPFLLVAVNRWIMDGHGIHPSLAVAIYSFGSVLATEILHWLDGRAFDPYDILFGAIGAVLGTAASSLLVKTNRSTSQTSASPGPHSKT
jgi:hypothetical protein